MFFCLSFVFAFIVSSVLIGVKVLSMQIYGLNGSSADGP